MKQRIIGLNERRRVRALLGVSFLFALLGWMSCASGTRTGLPVRPGALVVGALDGARTAGGDYTVVLVALDGVRWREILHGVERERALRQGMSRSELLSARELLPNLHALADRGAAIASDMAASGPNFVSVPGYQEMLTGLSPTGCTSNGCPRVRVPTIADDFAALPGTRREDVVVVASWEGIERAASRDPARITVSVGRTRGETRDRLRLDPVGRALLAAGEQAGPAPGNGDFRRDRETAAIALHALRVQRPRFLFLGLGETDEYAHNDDYRGYLQALTHADNVIGHVAAMLTEYQSEGRRTTLLVTTDHGRSNDFVGHGGEAPESAGVWLVAAGWGIRPQGFVTPTETRHLADVAATIRSLAKIGAQPRGGEPIAELLHPSTEAVALTH